MIIKRLRLNNFRQYEGDHEVEFADTGDSNVTVIEGPNGAGKSSMFLALNWCLYGEFGGDKGELLSKGVGTSGQGFVEVHFRHEGRQYIARRDIDKLADHEQYGDLSLDRIEPGAKVTSLRNPSQQMNGILPADARRYFFFDGEKIDEMSRPGHESEVNDAVRSVLKLRVLERAVKHMQKVEKDLAKSARAQDRVSAREAELIELNESLGERVRQLREQKTATLSGMKSLSEQIEELRTHIAEMEEVREIAHRERSLEADLAKLEGDRAEALDWLTKTLPAAAPVVARRALETAVSILDEKRAKGEIPSNIRRSLIDDLLAAGHCICERELDDAARDALTRRRDHAVSTQLEEAVQLAAGYLRALTAGDDDVLGSLKAALTERSRVIDEEEGAHRELGELRQKLKSDYSGTVAELGEKREHLEREHSDLRYRVGRMDVEIEATTKQREEVGVELAKIEATGSEARRARRKYELAAQVASAAEEILAEFRATARQQIETAADEVFKSLVWKEKQFRGVKISEDYALDVIDRHGKSALKELSAGERQVLSLSFIVGMTKVADDNSEAPFVIDTPLGRISEDVRENIARRLPELAPQVTLLVTDQELMGKARQVLEPRIGMEYRLIFDDAEGTTSVEEVHRD